MPPFSMSSQERVGTVVAHWGDLAKISSYCLPGDGEEGYMRAMVSVNSPLEAKCQKSIFAQVI